MTAKPQLEQVFPTPFGWVSTSEEGFDFNRAMAFRSQLLSLFKATNAQGSVAPSTQPATVAQEVEDHEAVLVPVAVRKREAA